MVLDLFCGAGGAAMGYHRAGFDVVGVDIKPQPRYPFPFVQGDALKPPVRLEAFDAIHASPPCQDYSLNLRGLVRVGVYPRLIDPIRDLARHSGLPWIIENVIGAPLPHQSTLDGAHGLMLCGSMFDLRVLRHRLFEASFSLHPPRGCRHSGSVLNPYDSESRERFYAAKGSRGGISEAFRSAIDVPWMSASGATEAIPPAYTEYIGHQLLESLERAA